jgi:YgiT-type zinc finger domain-containing protein
MTLYGFPCEYCPGTVREQVLEREPISHHRGIVILENVPIGVCDRCAAHYYAAAVLKRAEAVLKANGPPRRTVQVPVESFQP